MTVVYKIIHTMHYNLEQYQSRYSKYAHGLILSAATEVAMKHYRRCWCIFSSSLFSVQSERAICENHLEANRGSYCRKETNSNLP